MKNFYLNDTLCVYGLSSSGLSSNKHRLIFGVPQHVLVSIVRNWVDVGRHFSTTLIVVAFDNVIVVHLRYVNLNKSKFLGKYLEAICRDWQWRRKVLSKYRSRIEDNECWDCEQQILQKDRSCLPCLPRVLK